MAKRDQKVAIGYLHPADSVHPTFHRSLVNLLVHDMHHQQRIVSGGAHIALQSGANVAGPRNELCEIFLAGDADWLWMVDADMQFEPDVVDRLVGAAHPVERPLVGGLCFAVRPEQGHTAWDVRYQVWPTLFGVTDGVVHQFLDYPPNQLVQVDATGAACLLIHRSVLEGVTSDHPHRWFRESRMGAQPVSEDITFCLQAGAAGFPLHVHTGIETKHAKTWMVDATAYRAYREARRAETEGSPT